MPDIHSCCPSRVRCQIPTAVVLTVLDARGRCCPYSVRCQIPISISIVLIVLDARYSCCPYCVRCQIRTAVVLTVLGARYTQLLSFLCYMPDTHSCCPYWFRLDRQKAIACIPQWLPYQSWSLELDEECMRSAIEFLLPFVFTYLFYSTSTLCKRYIDKTLIQIKQASELSVIDVEILCYIAYRC